MGRAASSSSEDLSDSGSSYDLSDDGDVEPVCWNKLKDGWQEFLQEDNTFYAPTGDSSAINQESPTGGTNTQANDQPLQIEENKFHDPLGVLKIPPRKSHSVKSHLISLESEQFDPVVFLSEIHSQTKFTELSVGLSKLKEASTSKDLEIKFLVKDNFEHFVKCKDTVDEVYTLISNSKMLEDMSTSFNKIIDKSSIVYNPLLQGKQEADHIRKVLTLLNKFKFIFKLPGKIQENIRQGEFDKIVHNYKYAKSVITTNNKKAFQRVLTDIERIVEDFRGQMFTALRDPQSKPDYLKKVIRVLMEIGNGKGEWAMVGDPCWYCLSHKNKAITTLINQCFDDQTLLHHKRIKRLSILLLSNIPNLYKMGRSYVEGRFDFTTNQGVDDKLIGANSNLNNNKSHPLLGKNIKKKEKFITVTVHYLDESFSTYRVDHDKKIQDLVEMCMKRFVDSETEYCMYKLSEKKAKGDSVGHIKLVELDPQSSPYKIYKKWVGNSTKNHKFLFKKRTEEYSKNSKGIHVVQKDLISTFKSHKKQYSTATTLLNEEHFKKLIIELLELYAKRVEDLFFNDDDDGLLNILSPNGNNVVFQEEQDQGDTSSNMVENVNEVIKCHEMLVGLGMPEQYVESIKNLVQSLTLHFVNRICSEMVGEISFLYLLEDWTANDESQSVIISTNQVDGMITTKLLDEFYNCTKSNLDKLSFLVNNPSLLKHVEKALCEAIESFGDCLNHLAFKEDEVNATVDDQSESQQLDQKNINNDKENEKEEKENTIPYSKRLLLSLSNCSTVVSKTAIQLRDYYVSLYHKPCSARIKKAIVKLGILERRILERYVQEKSNELCSMVRTGILYSGHDWLSNKPPVKISSYLLNLLTKMVFIHNEVIKTINSLEVARGVITHVIRHVLVAFQHSYNQLDPSFINGGGQMQFLLDLQFFEMVLQSRLNENLSKLISTIKQSLYQQKKVNDYKQNNSKILEPIISNQLTKTSLLYSCLK